MATYANFHHIELDGIGNRKSTPRPIGGKSTIDFDEPAVTPKSTTPRKVKDHMKSNPLGIDFVDTPKKIHSSFESPPRSKQGSPTPTHSSDDVSDTCSETSSTSSLNTPVKARMNGGGMTAESPRQRPPPGGFAHKLW